MKRKVEYAEQGRSGYVVYSDPEGSIQLYYEFGGGDCVASLYLPETQQWEKETGRPLAQREEILTFIAESVVRDQASGGSYKISEQFIDIYSGRHV